MKSPIWEETSEVSGWFGYRGLRGKAPPPDEAYSRVTNPERFRPLHPAMLEIVDRLESQFEVDRTEGYGLDKKLERGVDLDRPGVRLIPRDPEAAPIAVSFSTFPGLQVRFGRWYVEPFPVCGCDACDESAEGEIERLNDMVDAITAGRFREAIRRPLISFRGSGWLDTRFWSDDRRSGRTSRVDGRRAREMAGGRRRLDLDWKPWGRRRTMS